uniref:Leishmanolysin-like peptidase n=1 Tax=Trypanosoma congolense (strain IL3000) TaxID=1068625 RepID=G0UVN0_TRYCI|nr:putative major surface protease gp63 [Trypanosoma congolense IL3000]
MLHQGGFTSRLYLLSAVLFSFFHCAFIASGSDSPGVEEAELGQVRSGWCGHGAHVPPPSEMMVFDETPPPSRSGRTAGGLITAQIASVNESGVKAKNEFGEYGQEELDDSWQPIRIYASTLDMDDPHRFCTRPGDVRDTLTGGGPVTCKEADVLTVRKKRIIKQQALPEAIKMHSSRLFVQRLQRKIVLGRHQIGHCKMFKVPEAHYTNGVDADLLVYVGVRPTIGSIAWAFTCGLLPNGRSVVGSINLSPAFVKESDFFIRVIVHELGHVLGFDKGHLVRARVLQEVRGVRGLGQVYVVNSTIAKRVAQKHFNCSDVLGIEMENEGGNAVEISHLEQRHAYEDVMSPNGRIKRYTAMTLAVFASLGYYRVNFSRAEPTRWGLNAGCGFLNDRCVVNGTATHPKWFCDREGGEHSHVCSYDHLSLGRCALGRQEGGPPLEYRYFSDDELGGTSLFMDYCPVVVPYSHGKCTGAGGGLLRGSATGRNSRCVKGVNLRYSFRDVGDVCVHTDCSGGRLRIRFLMDFFWKECKAGELVKPSNIFLWSGGVICPTREEVCFEEEDYTLKLKALPRQANDSEPAF